MLLVHSYGTPKQKKAQTLKSRSSFPYNEFAVVAGGDQGSAIRMPCTARDGARVPLPQARRHPTAGVPDTDGLVLHVEPAAAPCGRRRYGTQRRIRR